MTGQPKDAHLWQGASTPDRRSLNLDLSRRQILRTAFAGAVLLTAAGCSDPESSKTTRKPAGKPKSGGTLRVSHPNSGNNLDPALSQNVEDIMLNRAMYETLVFSTPDRTFEPLLATDWETSQDLKTWTFHLRPNVRFSSGKILTSRDVVYTFERVMDPGLGSQGLSDIDAIRSVRAPDDQTVIFDLKYPYSELLAPISESYFGIVPAGSGTSLQRTPDGTGPFTLDENVANDHASFVRNRGYWDKGLPYLDALVFQVTPEPAAQAIALANSETDVMWSVPPELFDQVEQTQGVVIEEIPTSDFSPLVLDITRDPFKDPRVRLAIRKAIDPQHLNEVTLKGHGAITPIPIAPNDPLFPDVSVISQDVEGAKRLMAEAGYANGFSTPMFAPSGRPVQSNAAVAIAQMVKPLKIDVNVKTQPLDFFYANTEGNGEAYIDHWTDQPGVDLHIYSKFHSGGFWNKLVFGSWTDEACDSALDRARTSLDTDERREQYGIVAERLNENGPGIFWAVANVAQAWRDNVQNLRTRPGSDFIAREVWLG